MNDQNTVCKRNCQIHESEIEKKTDRRTEKKYKNSDDFFSTYKA